MFGTMLSNDVRQTLDQFRRSVDRLFDEAYTPASHSSQYGQEWSFSPVIESAWTENEVLLRAIIPGVPEKDISVIVQGNQLIIQGERRKPENFDKNAWTQLSYGKFQTALSLPNGLNLEHVNCRLHDGVLDIRIPVAEAMKPRQVQIQTGEDRKAIGS
jgi:HSP20 family protein